MYAFGNWTSNIRYDTADNISDFQEVFNLVAEQSRRMGQTDNTKRRKCTSITRVSDQFKHFRLAFNNRLILGVSKFSWDISL